MDKQGIRIVEGSAKVGERFWRVIDAQKSASGDPAVESVPSIEFYGYISEYALWGDEITPALFKQDLERVGNGGPVQIRIHSGGGDVFAASAIRSILVDYPGKVTARIDGLCASAATMVALGADEIKMQDTAYFMIHDPGYSVLMGWLDATELSNLAEHLKLTKQGILDAYEGKTRLPREELSRMMRAETWMTAKQAAEYGFVDEIIGGKGDKVPLNASVKNAVMNGVNCPLEVVPSAGSGDSLTLFGQDCSGLGMGEQTVNVENDTVEENSAECDALLDELFVI